MAAFTDQRDRVRDLHAAGCRRNETAEEPPSNQVGGSSPARPASTNAASLPSPFLLIGDASTVEREARDVLLGS